jgi:very-short-patch-repair endonuclease
LRNKKLRNNEKSKSKFQYGVGQQLIQEYPHDVIFEEVIIPKDGFILDFFIPSLSLVIECHGRQHTEHVKYFHRTRKDFHNQQDIDNRKRNWCKLNNFKLIEIYDE